MTERRALIVVNRHGRRGRANLHGGIHVLEEAGFEVIVHYCREPERVPGIIAAHGAGAAVIIALPLAA